ncbi:hypothetical protein V6R21_23590 [Limibacter armeniacum]|uniref:hypothetical protein n=1 Tax=Limibacter armeniacum TaxID=466084 RepID=UPI002FE6AED7
MESDFSIHYLDRSKKLLMTECKPISTKKYEQLNEALRIQKYILIYSPSYWLLDLRRVHLEAHPADIVKSVSNWLSFLKASSIIKIAYVTSPKLPSTQKFLSGLIQEITEVDSDNGIATSIFENKQQAETWLLSCN